MPTTQILTQPSPIPSTAEPIAVCVDPAQIWRVWKVVSPFIKSATDRGVTPYAEVEGDVLSGRALLWLAWDSQSILGAAVTQLSADCETKRCTIVACGGTQFHRWKHLIASIERFAREEHCQVVRIAGRRGWKKVLPDYDEPLILLEKRLD